MDKNIELKGTRRIDVRGRVSTAGIFLKGAWCSIFRSQGSLCRPDPEQLVVEMKGVKPDPERVAFYRSVCGCRGPERDELPPAFTETLFLAPLGRLVTSRFFPLSPTGLIHVGQKITQYRPLPVDTVLDLKCGISRMLTTEKGIWLDVEMEARDENGPGWEGTASFLSRTKATQKGKGKKRDTRTEDVPPETSCIIEVPENTGRLYAKASGDYNPHHLYALTAKPLGYRRPIAHGMWSMSRSFEEIRKVIPVEFPFSVNVEFKLPIYMPAEISLSWKRNGVDGDILFSLTDARSGLPHLKGVIC